VIKLEMGLVKVNWDDINKYSEEEITYFLFLEGKSTETICKIRKIDSETVHKHIIEGKIKYRFLVRSNNFKELFEGLIKAGKQDKLSVLKGLSKEHSKEFINFIRERYVEMDGKEKEVAIWILGELSDSSSIDILIKASVHKFVSIRRMAVSAMGKICDIKSETALIRALEDENSQVVLYAIKALTKMGSKASREKIITVASKSDKDYIKNAAAEFMK
jgi:HEAT repeat protein